MNNIKYEIIGDILVDLLVLDHKTKLNNNAAPTKDVSRLGAAMTSVKPLVYRVEGQLGYVYRYYAYRQLLARYIGFIEFTSYHRIPTIIIGKQMLKAARSIKKNNPYCSSIANDYWIKGTLTNFKETMYKVKNYDALSLKLQKYLYEFRNVTQPPLIALVFNNESTESQIALREASSVGFILAGGANPTAVLDLAYPVPVSSVGRTVLFLEKLTLKAMENSRLKRDLSWMLPNLPSNASLHCNTKPANKEEVYDT